MPRLSSATDNELSLCRVTLIFGVSAKRFVDGVVDDFVREVVRT